MESSPIWPWYLKGLDGLEVMMTNLSKGCPPTEAQKAELRGTIERLFTLVS